MVSKAAERSSRTRAELFVDLLQEQDHYEFVIEQFLWNEIFDMRIERDKVTEKTADN